MSKQKPHHTDLLPQQAEILDILRAHGIKRAYVFGSGARGELTPASDIDLLVEFETSNGWSIYGEILLASEAIQDLTGYPVDMTTRIHPVFEPYILPELIELPL